MIRRTGLKRKSKTEFAKAVAKLDIALSNLVRQHYEKLGCATCNKIATWKEMDCGHFVRRECMSTRFNPRNVFIQCKKCNRFLGGMAWEMGRTLDQAWGEGNAEEMKKIGRQMKKWEVKELEQLTSAAKHSWLAYLTLYETLSPPQPLAFAERKE